MRSASVERRLQRGGKVAKTWRMRGGNHENDVGRGFRQYGGLASVVLLSACHSSCRGCRRRLKESGMLVASRKVRPCNGDECLAPLDPRAFDRRRGLSGAHQWRGCWFSRLFFSKCPWSAPWGAGLGEE